MLALKPEVGMIQLHACPHTGSTSHSTPAHRHGCELLFDRAKWHTYRILKPFYIFHKWSKSNFSLQYQYIAKQTGDENKENHQLVFAMYKIAFKLKET